MKTLIVEDVHFLALILDRILSPFGSCEISLNGVDAIEKYSRAFSKGEPFDLICLDILIPQMDGFEVLKNIRNFEAEMGDTNTKPAKIMVISTFNDSHTVAKAKKAGCDRYISKPFGRKKVLSEIESLGLIDASELPQKTKK